MANITVERESPKATPTVAHREGWDPFVTMRDLMRWDPFGESRLARWLEPMGAAFSPAFEVKETKDTFEFKADVPGVDAKDIDVKLTNNRLTISGKREAEEEQKGDTWYTCERTYGSFTRSFTLPEGADTDHVRASLDKGVLTLQVPKTAQAQSRKIPIGAGTAKPKA